MSNYYPAMTMTPCKIATMRWSSGIEPGRYACFFVGYDFMPAYRARCECVVDDFGNLVPVGA